MLKITVHLKNINFFKPASMGDSGGDNDDFFLTKQVFLRAPHPFWSVKKKFAEQMKNIRDMVKNILLQKIQKT